MTIVAEREIPVLQCTNTESLEGVVELVPEDFLFFGRVVVGRNSSMKLQHSSMLFKRSSAGSSELWIHR